MRVITLSGWGQPQESLQFERYESTPIPYAECSDVDTALAYIADQAKDCDAMIGWSLGGQLAVLAINKGLLCPEKLVLIGAPFQFVQSDSLPLGMPRSQYQLFRDNYAASPKRTLNKAWELIIKNDQHAQQLRHRHLQHDKDTVLQHNWQRWLHALEALTCHGLSFADFPPTLLLHGEKDMVVYKEQSEHYVKHLPQAELITFSGCGHAPHWHDPKKTQQHIAEFLHV